MKDFKLIKEIGKGAFGKVYLVKKKGSQILFAMKVIKFKEDIDQKFIENLQNEVNILGVIDGKFLAKAYFSFLENCCLFIVMEYMMGGDMRKFLDSWTYLEKEEAQYVMASLILGVKELHSKKVIHRDLKPGNMLLNEKGQIKIADFGLSEFHKEMVNQKNKKLVKLDTSFFKSEATPNNYKVGAPSNNIKINYNNKLKNSVIRTMSRRILNNFPKQRIVGTPDYIAPEVLEKKKIKEENMEAIDWWSVGCLMYEFLVGVAPFSSGRSIEEVFDNIKNNKIIWPEIGYSDGMMEPDVKDLICKFLERDVKKRWGQHNLDEIKKHKFFEGLNWDKIEEMRSPIDINLTEVNKRSFFKAHQNKKSMYFNFGHDNKKIGKNKLNRKLKDTFNLNRIDLLQKNNEKLVHEIKINYS